MKYVIASFIVLVLGFVGAINPLRDFVASFFSPLQFGLKKAASSATDFFSFAVSTKKLREDYIKLLEEKAEIESKLVEFKLIAEENKMLKQQLDAFGSPGVSYERKYVFASVLGNPLDSSGSSIVLDRGLRQGIKVGSNVVKMNYLVGVVREVSLDRSVVDLLVSPRLSITAYDIDSEKKVEGIVSGQFGSGIKMSRILSSEEVRAGDIIVSSGKDGKIAPGLILGKISSVETEPASPMKEAVLEPLVNFSRLDKVFVLTAQ